MQMHNVGIAKLRQARNVVAHIGDIERKQVDFRKVKVKKNHESLPEEAPLGAQFARQIHHLQVVGLLVAHQHTGLHAVIAQGLHEPVRRNGSTSSPLACVYNQYFHT